MTKEIVYGCRLRVIELLIELDIFWVGQLGFEVGRSGLGWDDCIFGWGTMFFLGGVLGFKISVPMILISGPK